MARSALTDDRQNAQLEDFSHRERQLLDEIEAQFVANDLACDQDDGRTIAIGLE